MTGDSVDDAVIRSIVEDEVENQVDHDLDREAVQRGLSVLGTSAIGMGLASISAVGTATGQQGSIGTADRPLSAVYADSINRSEDLLSLVDYIAVNNIGVYVDSEGNPGATPYDALVRLAYQDPYIEWDYLDGNGYQGGSLNWYSSGWSNGVLREWDGSQWQLLYSGDGIVDDFEAGLYEDQNNSLSDYYGGDLSYFARQQTTIFEGSYALSGDRSGGGAGIISTDGAWQSSQGDTLVWRQYDDDSYNNPEGGLTFFGQSESGFSSQSCYAAYVHNYSGEMRIYRIDDGSATVLNSTGSLPATNTWYKGEVVTDTSGGITFTTYDQSGTEIGTVSASDTTYTSGGTGFRFYDSIEYWDLVEVY